VVKVALRQGFHWVLRSSPVSLNQCSIFFPHGRTAIVGLFVVEVSISHTNTTHTRTPRDEWSVRRGDLYLTTHNNHMGQTTMPPARFEPALLARERLKDKRLRPRGHRDRQPVLHSHIYFVFHPCYIILATDSVVKWNTLSYRPKSATYTHNLNSFKI